MVLEGNFESAFGEEPVRRSTRAKPSSILRECHTVSFETQAQTTNFGSSLLTRFAVRTSNSILEWCSRIDLMRDNPRFLIEKILTGNATRTLQPATLWAR